MISKLQSLQLQAWPLSLLKRLQSRWWIGLLLLGGLAGGFGLYRTIATSHTDSTPLLTVPIERQNLPLTLAANGTVAAERTINLSPKTSGYLKQLLVKEGDRVRQGQIVAYMDDSNLQGDLMQARGQLAQAQANLNKLINGNRSQDIAQAEAQLLEAQAKLQELKTGNRSQDIAQAQARLQQAQAQLRQAEDDFQRNQSLLREGAISQQTLNQMQSTRDSAQAQVSEAEAALQLQQQGTRPEEILQAQAQVEQQQQALDLLRAGSRPEDIDAARAQVEAAEGNLKTIQTQVNDTVITAPFDGVVTKKYADPGSFVTPTTAGSSVEGSASNSILTLATTNQVVADLNESTIARVRVGQSVRMTADAYPDRTFTGKVSQIAAQASTVQNVTSFEVKISLEPSAQSLLKAGMNVAVEIQLGQLNQAIMAPSAAIVRQQNGSTGVYVLGRNQRPVFRPIQIGATVGDRTEIKSGLTGTEQVLISAPPGAESESSNRGLFRLGGGNRTGGDRNSQSPPGAAPPNP